MNLQPSNMENRLKTEVTEILRQTQFSTTNHQKCSIRLKKILEKSNIEDFTNTFIMVLKAILISNCGNVFLEKTLDFIATFCSTVNNDQKHLAETDLVEHPFISKIVLFLLQTSELINDIVRYRSCQLINKILNQLIGCDISSALCDHLEKYLLVRLDDPKYIIRQQAVVALHRLQNPTDPQDKIIQQFIHLMNSDTVAKMRLLCVEHIAGTREVMKHIINRILDVDINVRLAAYNRLSKFAEYLRISQKRHILHCGFLDKSDKVVDFVSTNLICKWLDHYDGNILLLMKAVRLDADETDIQKTATLFEYILEKYFKYNQLTDLTEVLHLNDTKLIPYNNLNWETAYYWRAYVQFLTKNDEFEEELEKVIPELVIFSRYVKEYYSNGSTNEATVEFLEKQFILKQLFLIVESYDFADIINRECLNTLVCNILERTDLMTDVIEVIVQCLQQSIPEINSRSRFISEIISEIMYPINPEESEKIEREKEFQLSQVLVKKNCLIEDQKKAIAEQDFVKAQHLKQAIIEINETYKKLKDSQNAVPKQIEKKSDIPTIIKYLDVAAGLLLSPQVTQLNDTLRALKDNVIQELLIHDNDHVRTKAFRCYALCCIVDKECALAGIHIFSTPILAYHNGEECDTQVLIVCISSVVDLLRIYGPQLMAVPENNVLSESTDESHERVFTGGTSLTELLQGLVDLMDDEQYEIQDKAVWGLCQLILSDQIRSPSLISRLVLKWCNPASESAGCTNKLSQVIGYTLEKIALMTQSAEQLEGAVLLTVKTLSNAPRTSPLADVNIDNIGNFMISLCKTSPHSMLIQSHLTTKICCEINDNPKSRLNLTLSKMLLMLDKPNDTILIRDLKNICEHIRDANNECQILKNIIKFIASLEDVNHSIEGLDSEKVLNSSKTV